ncbi:peptidase inhibitor family I36 protein [Microbispora siamensis]|uniref:Peptidase inhibitor family I36 n=1 Tax=Microbispora siamensis TaxID=564413 RepID=A0ABQ4H1M2_9ACTN|nr:peptidase inhibitor family I36 protein [Microbispora siamensis]GIH67594.1 hypothetical protein Msi02_84110 [Microbispora siamensis]
MTGIAAAAFTTLALMAPSAAYAQARTDDAPATTEAAVQRILQSDPDAKRIGPSEVSLAPGVTVSVRVVDQSPAVKAGTMAASDCPYPYLCLFDNAGFTGTQYNIAVAQVNACPDIPIDSWFAGRASSLVNHRPSGTVSTLWANSNGTGLLGYQHAYGYRANLALDSASIGGNWDNRIRSARVC